MLPQRVPLVDWHDWSRRWEAYQRTRHARRDDCFRVMLELVAEIAGPRPTAILDLGCGTGSLASRALERFPTTTVVAVDSNPLLLAIGREARGDAAGRLRWLRLDVRSRDLALQLLQHGPYDAVLSSGVVQNGDPCAVLHLYRALHGAMLGGAVYLAAERLMVNAPASRFAAAARHARERIAQVDAAVQRLRGDDEVCDDWWALARGEPEFAEILSDPDAARSDESSGDAYLPTAFHRDALALAGFAETAVVWRYLEEAIIAAIR
jgi:SAM-dependent methyltransferase